MVGQFENLKMWEFENSFSATCLIFILALKPTPFSNCQIPKFSNFFF